MGFEANITIIVESVHDPVEIAHYLYERTVGWNRRWYWCDDVLIYAMMQRGSLPDDVAQDISSLYPSLRFTLLSDALDDSSPRGGLARIADGKTCVEYTFTDGRLDLSRFPHPEATYRWFRHDGPEQQLYESWLRAPSYSTKISQALKSVDFGADDQIDGLRQATTLPPSHYGWTEIKIDDEYQFTDRVVDHIGAIYQKNIEWNESVSNETNLFDELRKAADFYRRQRRYTEAIAHYYRAVNVLNSWPDIEANLWQTFPRQYPAPVARQLVDLLQQQGRQAEADVVAAQAQIDRELTPRQIKERSEWLAAASAGDVQAKFELARDDARRTRHNASPQPEIFARALDAARNGCAPAQAWIGARCLYGIECPLDYAAALDWFQSAATMGDRTAKYGIALMYLLGLGVPKNLDMAKSQGVLSEFDVIRRDMGALYTPLMALRYRPDP